MLKQDQIDVYREKGYLSVERVFSAGEVQKMQDATDEFVEKSRSVTQSDTIFDLEPDHTAEVPKIRRLLKPHSIHPAYDEVLRNSTVLEIVSQLVGTEAVRFNGTKLNMKSGALGSAVEWHQDWAFYPHSNDDLLAVGVAIDEMTTQNGCLLAIAGSHKGKIHDHHQDGRFVGAVTEPDFDDSAAEPIEVAAGGISIHHVRTLHASMLNTSSKPRRLLLLMYCSGDSYSLHTGPGQIQNWEAYEATFLRGQASPNMRLTSCPVRLPEPGPLRPGSIFENQTVLKEKTFKAATR